MEIIMKKIEQHDILKEINKSSLEDTIISAIGLIFLCGLCFFIVKCSFEMPDFSIVPILLIGFLIIKILFILFDFISSIKILLNPYKHDIFQLCSSTDEIIAIATELDQKKIYEDNCIKFSREYIMQPSSYTSIISTSKVERIYKLIHSVGFTTDYYELIIEDNRKLHEFRYDSSIENSKKIDCIILILSKYCPNAKIGYYY